LWNKTLFLPAQWLGVALLYVLILASLTVWQSLQAPWLGLTIKSRSDQLVATVTRGPSATIPDGAILEAISPESGTTWLELQAIDVMEEPDLLPGYPELDAFFARQGEIAEILKSPSVVIRWQDPNNKSIQFTTIQPGERPLSSLSTLFWFQILICSLGCLIATWVWVLQPHEIGARMFGITGLLFPTFVLPAAIYSGRELALSENLFFTMSVANQLGSKMFGSAFVGIFMMHPSRLLNVRWLYGLFVLMFCWWIINAGRLVSSMDIGLRAGILFLLGLSFWFGFKQWRKSKGHPLQRASLRWLTLSLLLGASLYIFLFTASAGLGWITAIPQGYAFGFFLLIYIGIALGIGRYRLFDLDVWAYRLLLWITATLAVLLLDTALIVLLDWSQGLALGVSLWICGVLYFPVRQWLWQKLVSRKAPDLTTLLPELLLIAFSSTEQQRALKWRNLLNTIYTPLQIRQSCKTTGQAELLEGGLALLVPRCAGIPEFELVHRGEGKQLFSTQDIDFVNALATLMDKAEAARASKEQGAIEERRRITRDIHDDVGARLLMLIHSSENPKQTELARAAMEDLRAALSNIDGSPVLLEDAVADWRDEANQRCDAANIEMHWESKIGSNSAWLQPRLKTLLQRALRECITNAIKHGKPSRINSKIEMMNDMLTISVIHNGERSEPAEWTPGIGMKGLRDRLASCDGTLNATLTPQGETEVRIQANFCSLQT